eukprot:scaffold132727_cov20-Tisochrysis_lutea.AAC.1
MAHWHAILVDLHALGSTTQTRLHDMMCAAPLQRGTYTDLRARAGVLNAGMGSTLQHALLSRQVLKALFTDLCTRARVLSACLGLRLTRGLCSWQVQIWFGMKGQGGRLERLGGLREVALGTAHLLVAADGVFGWTVYRREAAVAAGEAAQRMAQQHGAVGWRLEWAACWEGATTVELVLAHAACWMKVAGAAWGLHCPPDGGGAEVADSDHRQAVCWGGVGEAESEWAAGKHGAEVPTLVYSQAVCRDGEAASERDPQCPPGGDGAEAVDAAAAAAGLAQQKAAFQSREGIEHRHSVLAVQLRAYQAESWAPVEAACQSREE